MSRHPSITYTVQPQRRTPGKGWQPSEPHEADRFAVLKIQHFRARGRPGTATRVISTWGRMAEAQAAADTLSSQARIKPRKLLAGDRWPAAAERKVIATGLGDDYHSLPTHDRYQKD